MTAQTPKPSCHDVMTGKWKPTEKDIESGRVSGFGTTVNIINGGIECGLGKALPKTQYRYEYYQYFCKYFGVNPGENITCSSQKPFWNITNYLSKFFSFPHLLVNKKKDCPKIPEQSFLW